MLHDFICTYDDTEQFVISKFFTVVKKVLFESLKSMGSLHIITGHANFHIVLRPGGRIWLTCFLQSFWRMCHLLTSFTLLYPSIDSRWLGGEPICYALYHQPSSIYLWLPPVSLTLWYLCSSNAQVWLVEFAVPALSIGNFTQFCVTHSLHTLCWCQTPYFEREKEISFWNRL